MVPGGLLKYNPGQAPRDCQNTEGGFDFLSDMILTGQFVWFARTKERVVLLGEKQPQGQ